MESGGKLVTFFLKNFGTQKERKEGGEALRPSSCFPRPLHTHTHTHTPVALVYTHASHGGATYHPPILGFSVHIRHVTRFNGNAGRHLDVN